MSNLPDLRAGNTICDPKRETVPLRVIPQVEDTVLTREGAQAFQDAEVLANRIVTWAVHERTRRHPHCVIARPTSAGLSQRYVWPLVLVGNSLDEVRTQIPLRLSPMPARPDDPATLVETWF